jgi:hypothetical protein
MACLSCPIRSFGKSSKRTRFLSLMISIEETKTFID